MKKEGNIQSIIAIILGIAIVATTGFICAILYVGRSNYKTGNPPRTEKKVQKDNIYSTENEKFAVNNFQVTREGVISNKQQEEPKSEHIDSEYIIDDSDTRLLTENDLAGLTKEELSYARNEIYARHGRIFKTENLKNYFASKSWYIPIYEEEDFPEYELTECEKDNAKFILSYEKKKGYQ